MIIKIRLKYSKFNKFLDLSDLSITLFEHYINIFELLVNPGYLSIMALEECLEVGDTIEGQHLGLQLVLSACELLIELLLGRHGVQAFHDLLQVGNGVLLEFGELVSRGFGVDLKGELLHVLLEGELVELHLDLLYPPIIRLIHKLRHHLPHLRVKLLAHHLETLDGFLHGVHPLIKVVARAVILVAREDFLLQVLQVLLRIHSQFSGGLRDVPMSRVRGQLVVL